MSEITLTVNSKQIKGKEGDTVLDVCKANGIDIPTLCHFEGITDIGACRLCIVEIEKERRPVPACTYPIRNGLVVQTHTEKLEKYRRLILELLFTERNHLCAYCVASGDCELQNLAYKYQMDNVRYAYAWPPLPVDTVNNYLVIDHNRCILCGRCIRTCDEITGAHVLDFGNRGWKEMVCADLNQPLGTSSCISCGACFQVCPTGAIFAKSSAYTVKPEECTRARSICALCGVGCEIDAMVKDNNLVRIDSAALTHNRGLLCHKGRFSPLVREHTRITTPLMRNNGSQLEQCSFDDAINQVAKRLGDIKSQSGEGSVIGLASSRASNEALKAFKGFITYTIGSQLVDTFDGDDYRVIIQGIKRYQNRAELDIEASIEEILNADCILVAGAHPLESHPVVGSYILRAVRQKNASLIVLDPRQNDFTQYTSVWLKPKEGKKELTTDILSKAVIDKGFARDSTEAEKIISELKTIDIPQACKKAGINQDDLDNAAEILGKSQNGVIVYGEGVLQHRNPKLITALLNLAALSWSPVEGKPKTISLKPRGNSRGAWDMGLADPKTSITASLSKNGVKAAYLFLADDYIDEPALRDNLKDVEFIVVQASYSSPLTSMAHVVLPSPTLQETEGTYTTLDGIVKSALRLVQPPSGVKQDVEMLQEIAKRLRVR